MYCISHLYIGNVIKELLILSYEMMDELLQNDAGTEEPAEDSALLNTENKYHNNNQEVAQKHAQDVTCVCILNAEICP